MSFGLRLTRVKRLTFVAAVLVAVSATAPPPAGAASALSGAGSTLVVPLEAEWSQAFQALHAVTVNYDPRGAASGISALAAGSVDFAVADQPMGSSELASCRGCYQLPWALSAIGIAYHVNGIGNQLHLTGKVLAEIYMGQITRWNDPQIQALNTQTRLPAQKITPVYRGDDSGETYAFTRYLSSVNGTWSSRYGYGTTVSFPVGIRGSDNLGVTTDVQSTNDTIGYIAVSYLIAHRLPAAAIQNADGKFEYPNLSNIENAAQSVRRVPASNALNIINPPKRARIAYPISAFSYVIVPPRPPQRSLVTEWLNYALGAGKEFAPGLDFASLPTVVLKASEATVKKLG
jgi:phosphate transport system substrate-binding protein